jgi:acyl-CoA synthetase (AMP-forming)/AMP-acid ligase II
MATLDRSLHRLQQTTNHVDGTFTDPASNLSVVHGPSEPTLVNLTMGELLENQCEIHGDKECLVLPYTSTRWTYRHLQDQSHQLAKALLALGLKHGDRVGIMAGNCEEYVALFFATSYIGCILVVLNSTYTTMEAQNALRHSGKCWNPRHV